MHTQNLFDQRLFGFFGNVMYFTGVELCILGFAALSRGQRFWSADHRHPSKLEATRAADGGMLTSEQFLKLCCQMQINGIQLLGPCVALFV